MQIGSGGSFVAIWRVTSTTVRGLDERRINDPNGRARARASASWARSRVPFKLQRRRAVQTVSQGGKSRGKPLQLQPSFMTYKIPLSSSRAGCLRGRPRDEVSGSKNSFTRAHCGSVTSEGYRLGMARSSLKTLYSYLEQYLNTVSIELMSALSSALLLPVGASEGLHDKYFEPMGSFLFLLPLRQPFKGADG